MNSLQKYIAMMSTMMAMGAMDPSNRKPRKPFDPDDVRKRTELPVIPKGCKLFVFQDNDHIIEFTREDQISDNISHNLIQESEFFYCVATTKKKAIAKFEKYRINEEKN